MRTKYETNVISKFLPLYPLSLIIPVPMSSCYEIAIQSDDSVIYEPECSTWWQWRGRVWNHKTFNERVGW